MKLKVVEITAFGRFHHFRMELPDGVVVFEGGNESGKTTLLAFILLMFYGNAGAEKSPDIGKSLRKRYLPWEHPEMMGGALEMEFQGQRYRVEKQFKNSWLTDKTVIYNRDTGERMIPDRQQEVGAYFFHMSADTFLKTMLLGETDILRRTEDSKELVRRLQNPVPGGDVQASLAGAEAYLENAKHQFVTRRGDKGVLVECRQREQTVLQQIRQREEKQKEYEELFAQDEEWTDDWAAVKMPLGILFGVLAALFVAAGVAVGIFVAPLGFLLAAAGLLLLLIYRNMMRKQELAQEDYRRKWEADTLRHRAYLKEQAGQNKQELERLYAELEQTQKQTAEAEIEYDGILLAQQTLSEAAKELSDEYAPQLGRLAGEYLSNLTRGKYADFMVTPELSVYVREQETQAYREWKYLSQATASQAYLALRLAVLDLLEAEGETLPLLMDDSFLSYDKTRLEDAEDFLPAYAEKKGRQILFFTCRSQAFSRGNASRIRLG